MSLSKFEVGTSCIRSINAEEPVRYTTNGKETVIVTSMLWTSFTEMPGLNTGNPEMFFVAFSVPPRKFRIRLHLTPTASFRIPANSLPTNRRYTFRHWQRRKPTTKERNDIVKPSEPALTSAEIYVYTGFGPYSRIQCVARHGINRQSAGPASHKQYHRKWRSATRRNLLGTGCPFVHRLWGLPN